MPDGQEREVGVVMHVVDSKNTPAELKRHLLTDEQEERLKRRFKKVEDPLCFVVVTAKWMTGFNAPIEGSTSLVGANLTSANLTYADLTNADLTNADLTNADIPFADLGDADLPYADLTGANLTAAELSGANLTNARGLP